MVNFPSSLDSLANPTSSTFTDDTGYFLDVVISTLNDIAEALEAKLGTGASTPIANSVLRGTGTGTSAWTATPTVTNLTTTGYVLAGTIAYAGDGSAATPSHSFGSDGTNGMYLSAASTVGISSAGVNRVSINASGLQLGTNLPIIPAAVSGTPAQHALYRENVVKGWVEYTSVTTTAIIVSFNVSSVTDNGTGDTTVTWDRDFAAANYALLATPDTGAAIALCTTRAAGTSRIQTLNLAAAAVDVITNAVILGTAA